MTHLAYFPLKLSAVAQLGYSALGMLISWHTSPKPVFSPNVSIQFYMSSEYSPIDNIFASGDLFVSVFSRAFLFGIGLLEFSALSGKYFWHLACTEGKGEEALPDPLH